MCWGWQSIDVYAVPKIWGFGLVLCLVVPVLPALAHPAPQKPETIRHQVETKLLLKPQQTKILNFELDITYAPPRETKWGISHETCQEHLGIYGRSVGSL